MMKVRLRHVAAVLNNSIYNYFFCIEHTKLFFCRVLCLNDSIAVVYKQPMMFIAQSKAGQYTIFVTSHEKPIRRLPWPRPEGAGWKTIDATTIHRFPQGFNYYHGGCGSMFVQAEPGLNFFFTG